MRTKLGDGDDEVDVLVDDTVGLAVVELFCLSVFAGFIAAAIL